MHHNTSSLRYATIEKHIGETPLIALERLRKLKDIPEKTPLAYAGRLDPMASGTLLILIGDECKNQKQYHSLDKEYQVELILGLHSDSGDVLGVVKSCTQKLFTESEIKKVFESSTGNIALPYPHFSSKTVAGKPLHTWALLGKIHEITVPIKHSKIYRTTVTNIRTVPLHEIIKGVRNKIESIPTVTDPKKALGADFRRDEVRNAWNRLSYEGSEAYQIISFTCTASSGTYMRSLCEHIAQRLGTCGMAYAIHRTKIGTYIPLTRQYGMWWKRYV